MAKAMAVVAETSAVTSPVDLLASASSVKSTLSGAKAMIETLSSGTPMASLVNGQLKKIVLAKMESEHGTFADFISAAKNPLIRLMAKSPTISTVLDMVDKGVESGLLTDDILLEVISEPEALGEIFSELYSLV